MCPLSIPQHSDWDYFWDLPGSGKFSQISWSKQRIIRVIQPFLRRGGRALDAGCGSGFFTKYFCDQGMVTVALDFSESALKRTEQLTQGLAKIIKKDLLSGDLQKEFNEQFDVIFSDGLLEHFPLDKQDIIIQNLRLALSPQGVLMTFVPNRWSPWELIRPLFMPGINEKPFILKELVAMNVRNCLRVIEKGGINALPFRFSPEKILAQHFGMLLYTISRKNF